MLEMELTLIVWRSGRKSSVWGRLYKLKAHDGYDILGIMFKLSFECHLDEARVELVQQARGQAEVKTVRKEGAVQQQQIKRELTYRFRCLLVFIACLVSTLWGPVS